MVKLNWYASLLWFHSFITEENWIEFTILNERNKFFNKDQLENTIVVAMVGSCRFKFLSYPWYIVLVIRIYILNVDAVVAISQDEDKFLMITTIVHVVQAIRKIHIRKIHIGSVRERRVFVDRNTLLFLRLAQWHNPIKKKTNREKNRVKKIGFGIFSKLDIKKNILPLQVGTWSRVLNFPHKGGFVRILERVSYDGKVMWKGHAIFGIGWLYLHMLRCWGIGIIR